MNPLYLFLLLCVSMPCVQAQAPAVFEIPTTVLSAEKLPVKAQIKGKTLLARQWTDKNGDNLIVLTETEPTEGKDEKDGYTQEIYAYHFATKGTQTYQLVRQIYDFEKDCPLDITLHHKPESLTVTDLDKDGLAEVTFLYTTGCKGDVSPDGLKLMLLENGQKYAIRGNTVLYRKGKPSPEYNPGKPIKEVDAAFKQAPKPFLDYANRQWETFKVQKLD